MSLIHRLWKLIEKIWKEETFPSQWEEGLICPKYKKGAASLTTGYGLGEQGVRVRFPVRSRIISSPRHPDRLWGPPSPLSNGYWGLFPRG
jgi:hypothetical protein